MTNLSEETRKKARIAWWDEGREEMAVEHEDALVTCRFKSLLIEMEAELKIFKLKNPESKKIARAEERLNLLRGICDKYSALYLNTRHWKSKYIQLEITHFGVCKKVTDLKTENERLTKIIDF